MRDDDTPCCEPRFWINLAISLFLVLFAGLTSGLSIGLLSYSQVDLEVLTKAGLPQDKKNAGKYSFIFFLWSGYRSHQISMFS